MTRLFTVRRLVLSLVVVGALALIAVGLSTTKEPENTVDIAGAVVKQVFPPNGNLDLRQAVIGFQLDQFHAGRLIVDDTPIPDDQVRVQAVLNIYRYQPGPGTETGALAPGMHTATVVFWERSKGETDAAQRYTWRFTAH
jgi:hypothetical protein